MLSLYIYFITKHQRIPPRNLCFSSSLQAYLIHTEKVLAPQRSSSSIPYHIEVDRILVLLTQPKIIFPKIRSHLSKMERMNCVAQQNLYFQQGDDLCFQTTIPNHTHIIQGMLPNHPPMSVDSSHELLQKGKPKKLGEPITHVAKGGESHTSKKKKIVHRDIERQRRQEMSTLYMLLRSHLPLEYLKGKKSISDHMCEAANYINHLKAKIEELTEKRDQMRRLITSSSSNSRYPQNEALPLSPDISLRATSNGAAVLIVDRSGHELPLSLVIAALEEEGLDVISVSTCMNTQSVHNIECESNGPRVDSSRLEQKLRDSVCLAH